MRIIAGKHRGRKLLTPKDDRVVRPTTDFTREALFSILGQKVVGAKVLDLFGGTGALSLESMSRGAYAATTCDLSRESLALIRKNAEMMGERLEIVQGDFRQCCKRLEGRQFDLIFLDPPYAMESAPVLRAIAEADLAAEGCTIVYEHDAADTLAVDGFWHITDNRRYGRVALTFITKEMV